MLQFPFWCRAIYSFSGERPEDLGFIEGDLIECLNEGDGQWLVGRLKRNKTTGYFPSNFVEILPNSPPRQVEHRTLEQELRRVESLRQHQQYLHQHQTLQLPPQSQYQSPPSQNQQHLRSPHNHHLRHNTPPNSSHLSYEAENHHQNTLYQSVNEYDDDKLVSSHSQRTLKDLLDDNSQQFSTTQTSFPVNLNTHSKENSNGLNQALPKRSTSIREPGFNSPSHDLPKNNQRRVRSRSFSGMNFQHHNLPDLPKDQEQSVNDIMHSLEVMTAKDNGDYGNFSTSYSFEQKQLDEDDLHSANFMPPSKLTNADRLDHRMTLLEKRPGEFRYRSDTHIPPPVPKKSDISSPSIEYSENHLQPIPQPPPHRANTIKSSITQASSVYNNSAKSATSNPIFSLQSQSAFSATPESTLNRRKSLGSLASFQKLDTHRQTLRNKKSGILKRIVSSTKTLFNESARAIDPSWFEIQKDVYRSSTPTPHDLQEKWKKFEALGVEISEPVEEWLSIEGDEASLIFADPESNNPPVVPLKKLLDLRRSNFDVVDKAVRHINSWSQSLDCESLASTVICRPYNGQIQKLRAIFTFLAEKISWDRDFNPLNPMEDEESTIISTSRVLETRHATAEEIATCFSEMCDGIGVVCEVIKGHLRTMPDDCSVDSTVMLNHAWNAVLIHDQWRMIDASLASRTHPKRPPSSANKALAESFFFLTRPSHLVFTHIPISQKHQHIVPPLPVKTLMELPWVAPAYFDNYLSLYNFDTSKLILDGEELAVIDIAVAEDVECVIESESEIFVQDGDGDWIESGTKQKKLGLAQPMWIDGQRIYRLKAYIPEDGTNAIMKVYSGKKGLMLSIKDNPHPLALVLRLMHNGENTPFEFVTRHPTPFNQRHDLYLCQPQCQNLEFESQYLFKIRQYPSNLSKIVRGELKPARLSIQSPSGKVYKMTRSIDPEEKDMYEAAITCSEVGKWRGLVLGDSVGKWCVMCEWVCK